MASHSLNSLRRWSCGDAELPSVDSVKALHVYDFDNTLFASPLPNRQIWQGGTIGMLQSQTTFVNGGWWHDASILKATGDGIDVEESRGWKGWWNEHIVDLVRLSMQQKDALTVLLTGRSERGFADVLQRMAKSRKLEFDLIVLRPQTGPANQHFVDTMAFKQVFLRDLIDTYSTANEIRLYEDRVKQSVAKFREFFTNVRTAILSSPNPSRKPIKGEVIEVAENALTLDPLTEVAEVQRMLNTHNTAYAAGTLPKTSIPYEIKRLVLYTGYLLTAADTTRLLSLAKLDGKTHAYHTMANNVMITPRPCPAHILTKVGGLGHKFRWKAIALGSFDDKVWAMRVEPVPSTEPFYSENPVPVVVLATKGFAKPHEASRIVHWKPLAAGEMFEFDTEVGEKALLRIEQERRTTDDNNDHATVNGNGKRRQTFEEDFPPLGTAQKPSGGGQGQRRDFSSSRGNSQRGRGGASQNRGGGQNRGRGGSQRGRGGNAGGGANSRGRGAYSAYQSRDDGAARGGKHNAFPSFGGDGANDRGLTY